MNYLLVEEASDAIEMITDDLQEAIHEAKRRRGKYLVVQDDEHHDVVFDLQPGVTYKI